MVYLYYYDGKLREAPHKMPNACDRVKSRNNWTHKLDATNGYTSLKKRLEKISKLNLGTNVDFHVLTNCPEISKKAKYVFTFDREHNAWVIPKERNFTK